MVTGVMHGFRTLSWGGARLDEEQLQERAMRITGTHMDGLMDGLAQGQQDPQTPLQNAVLVRLPSLPQHGDASSTQEQLDS